MSKLKLEKTVSESHREYLDLDTDEEEFGKQETPEPEDEAILEPEKPTFTNDELETLVRHVKMLTTLPHLKVTDWNEKCEATIRIYFCEPANPVLTIFFEDKILKARLGMPTESDSGLSYFLRAPWQIYNPENFFATVVFGVINKKIEKTILSWMENLFAPIAFDSTEWPETSKYDIFENLHKLILCLTNIVYDPMRLTILYIPTKSEEINLDNEQVKDEDLDAFTQKMGRLGRISRTWILQLQNSLSDSFYIQDKYENTVADEVQFWAHRYANLNQILQQLSNENVKIILNKLKEENSPSAKKIYQLKSEIIEALNSAKLNLGYVNSLLTKCQILEQPSDIEKHTNKILSFIKDISENSTYYNSINGVEKLCRLFSLQVIKVCQNYIDLNVIFEKRTAEAKEMLETCIVSCQKYKQFYNQMTEKESSWATIKSNIFKYVTIFEERCRNLMEICDAMAVFAKVPDVCPLSSGPKSKCNELRFLEIHRSFCDSLQKISQSFACSLDVTSVQWYRRMQRFKLETKKLEQKIEQLVDEVVDEDVHCASDSIDIIYTMLEFKHTAALKKVLLRVWLKTWKMFIDEIKQETRITKLKIGEIPSNEELRSVTNKLHYVTDLCSKMSQANVRLRDYCGIFVDAKQSTLK